MKREKINVLKYNVNSESYEMLFNAYSFEEDVEVYISNNYKLVIRDSENYQIIEIPERVKVKEVQCCRTDTKLLFIRLVLQDINIPTKWISYDEE